MKPLLQNKLTRFVFLLLAIACTKEVTDDLLITFKVTAPADTLNCFVNIARPFDVTIRGINANTAGNYQFKYAIESGAGYLTYRGTVVEQDALVMLSGSTNELQFVGTEVGAANIVITVVNGSGEEKGFSLKCNVQETAFFFDVIPSAGALSPNSMIDLAMSINEINPSTYQTKYEVLPADEGTVAGSGSVIVNGTALANNTFVDTQSGQFTWKFMADELGPVKLKFTTENGFGVIAEKEISLQVSETPQYTFTAVAGNDVQADIDQSLGIDFNLVESSGTSTYTMTFTNTNTGSLIINGTSYEAGDTITITPESFTGNYTGTEAGDHTLTFTVQNAFDPPLERTATLTFTYIDPNSNKPIITLGGDGEQLQLCQGTTFVETVTAIDAQGNAIPTSEIMITGSVDETMPGSYGLTYNVSDTNGNQADEVSRTVTITALPTAIIGADVTSGQAPLDVVFNPTGSTAAAPATLVSVQYIYGDGTQSAVLDFPSNAPSHTYQTAERFTAQVIVTDSNGCTATQNIEVNAAVGMPVINLNGGDITQCQGGAFVDPMNATDADGNDITDQVVVSIDPDTFGNAASPNPGTYTFTYTLTDAETKTRTVTIINSPLAQIQTAVLTVPTNQDITFNAVDNNPNAPTAGITYSWVFTNGFTSDLTNVTTSFDTADTYNVSLRITYNNTGCFDETNIDFEVTQANQLPTAQDIMISVDENSANNPIDVAAFIDDDDGDSLTLGIVTNATNGNSVISGSTTISYSPDTDYSGPDTIVYQVSDGVNPPVQATITISVDNVNIPPTAQDFTATVDENSTDNPIDLTPNISDPDGDTLTTAIVTQPTNGTASITGNIITYTPNPNYDGADAIIYSVNDGVNPAVNGTISVDVTPLTNEVPVAVNDNFSTNSDSVLNRNVLANDTDNENDPLDVERVQNNPSNIGQVVFANDGGQFTITVNGNVTFDPAGDFNDLTAGQSRTTSITYRNTDGNSTSNEGIVNITVNGVGSNNVAPNAVASANPTSGTAPLDVQFTGDQSNDPNGDTLTYSWNFGDGTTSTQQNPSHTYTTDGNYSVSLTVSDGALSDVANITINVSEANVAPNAVASANPTSGTAPLDVQFTGDQSNDPNGDTLTYSWNFGDGTTSTQQNPSHTYTTDGNYSVSLTVSDGALSDVANITITVSQANQPPLAVNDDDVIVQQNSTQNLILVVANDSDPENDDFDINTIPSTPNKGTATIVTDAIDYVPTNGQFGNDTFTYNLEDINGNISNDATVSVFINRSPVANNTTRNVTSRTQVVSITISTITSDPDGHIRRVTSVTNPSGGNTTINAGQTSITFTGTGGSWSSTSFNYTISDGFGGSASGTIIINYNPVIEPIGCGGQFQCSEGFVCVNDVCVPCGGPGQPCP